jgi:D-lactate dehydrogenase (cytochrome)
LLAANINSPLRMRYGSLRDLTLATTVAMADGRVIRAGRPVVKNVAGYDLAKLFIGAHGTLGLLVDVTLKLTPRPRARRSLAVHVKDLVAGLEWAEATAPYWLATSGVVLLSGVVIPGILRAPYTLIFSAEGMDEDITPEFNEIGETLKSTGAPRIREVSTQSATDLWAEFMESRQPDQLLVRVGVPPGTLSTYMNQVPQALRASTTWCFDVASGFAYAVASPPTAGKTAEWLAALREPALVLDGYAVIMQTPDGSRGHLDAWGYRPEALDMMTKLKTTWDPASILNPGAFVTG